jgi:hypothetical protein
MAKKYYVMNLHFEEEQRAAAFVQELLEKYLITRKWAFPNTSIGPEVKDLQLVGGPPKALMEALVHKHEGTIEFTEITMLYATCDGEWMLFIGHIMGRVREVCNYDIEHPLPLGIYMKPETNEAHENRVWVWIPKKWEDDVQDLFQELELIVQN